MYLLVLNIQNGDLFYCHASFRGVQICDGLLFSSPELWTVFLGKKSLFQMTLHSPKQKQRTLVRYYQINRDQCFLSGGFKYLLCSPLFGHMLSWGAPSSKSQSRWLSQAARAILEHWLSKDDRSEIINKDEIRIDFFGSRCWTKGTWEKKRYIWIMCVLYLYITLLVYMFLEFNILYVCIMIHLYRYVWT